MVAFGWQLLESSFTDNKFAKSRLYIVDFPSELRGACLVSNH